MHAEQMLNAELETTTTQSAHAQLDTLEIHLNIAHSNVSASVTSFFSFSNQIMNTFLPDILDVDLNEANIKFFSID